VQTLTFLFTDIEGSTALLRRLGEGDYGRVLADHQALIRAALAAHDGQEVDTQGDAFFAVFSSPTACVAAVLEMQRALEARAWPGGEHVRVRMGVHTGEAATSAAGALVGLDVHRAARVGAIAHGGQVLLSETAAALVRDSLPPGAALRDLGAQRLKDLGRPVRVFQLDAAGLPAGFPPLRALGNPALPNNLPGQLSAFIGRDRERSEVRALVASRRLVTLTGPGGSGKTRLALQVAAELLDGSGDGVWLAELAAVADPDAVPAAIGAALGIGDQPGRAVLDGLLAALALQSVLIVLDNCEHLIGACAKTADAIVRHCPGVRLLVTSREPLGISGESIYRVPSLSLPDPADPDLAAPALADADPASCDAIALLAERAREQGVDLALDEETLPLMVSVCRRLDGLPLAIELAAARLRSLSLAGLRDRLDQRFRLLTGGSRTALARQQTLRATVDWSYSLLNPAEQALLRLLSVFAEGFDLDAVEGVRGGGDIEAFDTADLLGSLVDKSLVVAEPAGGALRYRLLETIRQFAAERLAEAGQEATAAAAAAHSRYFLALAEAAGPHLSGPGQGRWFARLDTDHANLRRAIEHAASDPDGTARVLRCGVALRGYWLARSRCREALGLLLPVLDRPGAGADPGLFVAALVTVAGLAPLVDIAPARRYGHQAVELARQLGDDRLLADALGMLSAVHFFAGEPDRGLPLGREAVDRARQLGDDVLLGRSLMICQLSGDLIEPAQSARLLAEAIACAERSGNHLLRSHLHNNAAVQALGVGHVPAARAHLDQAAQAARATGQENPAVAANLGWVQREAGHPAEAQSWFEASLRIGRRSGEEPVIACAILGLGCLAADLGDWDRSAVLHGVAQAFLDRSGEPWQGIEARYRERSLARVRAHLGDDLFDRDYAQGLALSPDEALPTAVATPGS
jgi:predicted ATPase/class 3 adenylate cyclase